MGDAYRIMGKGAGMNMFGMAGVGCGDLACCCICLAMSIPAWQVTAHDSAAGDWKEQQGLFGKANDNKDYKTFDCSDFENLDTLTGNGYETQCNTERGLMVVTFVFSLLGLVCNAVGMFVKPGNLGAA